MQGIEEIIRKNKEAFNINEPSPEHFDKFREKLADYHSGRKESWFSHHGLVLRIAAGILVFIAIGTLYYTNSFKWIINSVTGQIATVELPVEIREVMTYYNMITDKKVSQIDQLATSGDEAQRIKEMALKELQELDNNKLELEKEHAQNPNNERILNALVLNQQKKSEILDKIINTISQVN